MNEFLFSILSWINSWVGNWGWSMVVFTIMIRLVLTPLDVKSRVSMRKTTKLQPMQQALQKKYANDKEKLNQKMAELYKKEHINPLSSCLPMLLTWPILIAVFGAMRMAANKELLVQVGEILNGQAITMEPWLWIKNLWMADNIFTPAYPDLRTLQQISSAEWTNWFNSLESMPPMLASLNLTAESFGGNQLMATVTAIQETMVAGNETYAHAIAVNGGWTFSFLNLFSVSLPNVSNGLLLLPILSAVTQIVMTKITGGNQQNEQSGNSQAASTGKFMMYFFPVFSLMICLGYSSAFALYWVSGNLIMTVQTIAINKILDNKEQQAAPVAGEGTIK